jgi:hypothetical protein
MHFSLAETNDAEEESQKRETAEIRRGRNTDWTLKNGWKKAFKAQGIQKSSEI